MLLFEGHHPMHHLRTYVTLENTDMRTSMVTGRDLLIESAAKSMKTAINHMLDMSVHHSAPSMQLLARFILPSFLFQLSNLLGCQVGSHSR